MSLPKILTEHRTVTVEGVDIDIRALTRAEAARMRKMAQDGAGLADLEILVLSYGTDTPKDEAREWYEATASGAVNDLIEAIRDLSGLGDGAQKSGGTSDRPGGG